jgi:hypothetical protein
MKKHLHVFSVLVFLTLWLQPAVASGAWWVLCDSCTSNTDYRNAVLAAPGGDRIYYVSNSNTLDTRKYEKYSTYEDFDGGVVEMTWVSDLALSSAKQDAFGSVLQSADALFTVVDGAALGGGSIADHISDGVLSTGLLATLRMELITRGFFPTAQQAGETVGTGLGTIWRRELSRTESTARQRQLRIRVPYPDDSQLEITLSPDAQTWSELSAKDADGNTLPVHGPDSSGHAPVESGGFIGRSFSFGTGSGVDDLLYWLVGNQGLECDSSFPPGRVVVACRRPD